jgi:hypothetical protein
MGFFTLYSLLKLPINEIPLSSRSVYKMCGFMRTGEVAGRIRKSREIHAKCIEKEA